MYKEQLTAITFCFLKFKQDFAFYKAEQNRGILPVLQHLTQLIYLNLNEQTYPPKSVSSVYHGHNPNDNNCIEQDYSYNNPGGNFHHP